MQCQIIHDAPIASLNYLIYPDQHPDNQAYILNQLDAYTHLLLDTGKQYFSQAKEMYERINDSGAIRAAKAALRMAKGIVRPNTICPLTTLEDLRTAPPIMQRYIMAEPTLRQLYNDQRADGYSDSYFNPFPNVFGPDHYDYKQVMSGMVEEFVDESGEDCWKTTMYAYDLLEGDVELTFDNKVDIIPTWEFIRMAIEAGEDPSDVSGGKL